MKTRYLIGAAGIAGAVIAVGQLSGADNRTANEVGLAPAAPTSDVQNEFEVEPQGEGTPDVILFEIFGTANWSQGDVRAFAFGTNSCNLGDVPLVWQANNNQHPVIGQNMFKLAPGPNGHLRIEQLGQSWLKHGFCALDQSECGDCQGTGCSSLGVGCSDPYTAFRNGGQSGAGPKYQVNATNGFFPYPPANPAWSGQLDRRLQVPLSEVLPAENPDATYIVEGQYVCPDENVEVDIIRAANNVSWRIGELNSAGALVSYDGETQIGEPALYAWKQADPDVNVQWRAINGIGNFFVASQAYDNGDGTWDYEYVVHNLDSDRAVGSVAIDVDESVSVTGVGFHDVDYHSGEPFDGTDWGNVRDSSEVRWSVAEPFSVNPNGNAIRWGTAYNFRFTADSGPTTGTIELGLFKDGDGPNSVLADVKVPLSLNFCAGDFNDDGLVGFDDLTSLLSEWGFCFECPEDLDGDFVVDFDDLVTLLGAFGPCP